jgi:hypothetical protein
VGERLPGWRWRAPRAVPGAPAVPVVRTAKHAGVASGGLAARPLALATLARHGAAAAAAQRRAQLSWRPAVSGHLFREAAELRPQALRRRRPPQQRIFNGPAAQLPRHLPMLGVACAPR